MIEPHLTSVRLYLMAVVHSGEVEPLPLDTSCDTPTFEVPVDREVVDVQCVKISNHLVLPRPSVC